MSIISDDDAKINLIRKEKKNSVTKPEIKETDRVFENSIRPQNFNTYIGQGALIDALAITIDAAKKRNKVLDHLLFYGPPGLGKTTLAGVIANEMGVSIKVTSAPALERPRDIIGILMSLEEGQILFIDEIHRLNKVTEEILYPAMEDFYLDMTTGKSQTAKTLRVPLPKFTLIGATTKAGELSGPLRDRFGIIHRLQFYTYDELSKVIKRTAQLLEVEIDDNACYAIAKRSRGTPRIANRLIKRVCDYSIVKYNGLITERIANDALDLIHIDEFGLDNTDRNFLKLIIEKFNGGPVGLETIAAALGEDARTLEDVCEPYLLQCGFIERTSRGRKASCEAYRHLGYKTNNSRQQNLF